MTFLGHDVLRLNHVGDWGTQFGMLIYYLKSKHGEMLREVIAAAQAASSGGGEKRQQIQQAAEKLNIGDLVEFYKAAKKEFDEDISFQEAARQEVVRLQSGDADSLFLWQVICEKSRQEFQQIYDLLHVDLVERGESFYNPFLSDIVTMLEKQGLVTVSEGAKCVFLTPPSSSSTSNGPPPMIVQKSDGGYLYATTDLAALQHRVNVEHADHIIIVTDSGQAGHFHNVFTVGRRAGLLRKPNQASSGGEEVKVTHVPFGLVLGEDGKKIKTRAGESVKLKDLLNEAVLAAQQAFLERSPEAAKEEVEQKSKVMGIAAVKYADLSMNRESNYKFSFQKMLSLQGNTAPYMLYAYVRIQGIKRKAGEVLLDKMAAERPPRGDAQGLDQALKDLLTRYFSQHSLGETCFLSSSGLKGL